MEHNKEISRVWSRADRDFRACSPNYILNTEIIDAGIAKFRFRHGGNDITFLVKHITGEKYKYEVEMTWNFFNESFKFTVTRAKVLDYLVSLILIKQSFDEWKEYKFIIAKLLTKSDSGRLRLYRIEDGLGNQANIDSEALIIALKLGVLKLVNAELIEHANKLHHGDDVIDLRNKNVGYLHPSTNWENIRDI